MPSTPEAIASAWPWRAAPAAVRTDRARRTRALLQAGIAALAATLLTAWRGHRVLGLVLYAASAVLVVCGWLAPRAFAAIERGGRRLGLAAGALLTWLLLVPFFYLCFVPGRLVQRLARRDPMRRRWDPARPSYWTPCPDRRDPGHFTRQY